MATLQSSGNTAAWIDGMGTTTTDNTSNYETLTVREPGRRIVPSWSLSDYTWGFTLDLLNEEQERNENMKGKLFVVALVENPETNMRGETQELSKLLGYDVLVARDKDHAKTLALLAESWREGVDPNRLEVVVSPFC